MGNLEKIYHIQTKTKTLDTRVEMKDAQADTKYKYHKDRDSEVCQTEPCPPTELNDIALAKGTLILNPTSPTFAHQSIHPIGPCGFVLVSLGSGQESLPELSSAPTNFRSI